MKYIIGFLLYSNFSFALNCGNMADGEIQRLDVPGKSLEKVKTQDQDGLGLCYASSTSILLQSAIPGNPDVSYINLALGYGEKVNTQLPESSYAYKKNGSFLLNAGEVCTTIKVAKENGGICERKNVPIEASLFNQSLDGFTDPTQYQKQLLTAVSNYYDNINKAFKGEKKLQAPNKKTNSFVKLTSSESNPENIKKNEVIEEKKSPGFLERVTNGFKSFFKSIFGGNRESKDDASNSNIAKNNVEIIDKSFKSEENNIVDKKENNIPSYDSDLASKKLSEEKDAPKEKEEIISDNLNSPDNTFTNREESPEKIEVAEEKLNQDISTNSNTSNDNLINLDNVEALKKLNRPLSKKEEYQVALYNLIKNRIPAYSIEKCQEKDYKNVNTVMQGLSAFIYNASSSFKKNDKYGLLRSELYSTIMRTEIDNNITYEFKIRDDIKKAISNYYMSEMQQPNKNPNGKKVLSNVLKKVLPKEINSGLIDDALEEIDPNISSLLDDDYKRYALKNYSQCAKDKKSYFLSEDGLEQDFKNSDCLKQYANLGKNIKDLILAVDNKNSLDFDKLLNFIISSPDLNYDKAIALALSPDCTDANRVKIPENLTCSDHFVTFNNVDVNRPETYMSQMITEKNKFKDKVTKSIDKNLAVSASVCTSFFQNDPNYFYNSNLDCSKSSEDALHAVSIIGYRCNDGKIDYLVQNSWGSWSNLDSKFERDSKMGRAWIDEDTIIKNTFNYVILNK